MIFREYFVRIEKKVLTKIDSFFKRKPKIQNLQNSEKKHRKNLSKSKRLNLMYFLNN